MPKYQRISTFFSDNVFSWIMSPAECRLDLRLFLIQSLVPTERIRLQNPGEAFQEPLDITPAPGHGILVQDHRSLRAMLRGAVHEHIALGIAAAPVLRHLAGRLVRLKHIPFTQMLPQSVIHQAQIPLRTPDDPVGHGGPAQEHIVLLKVLGDPVQRDGVGVLGIHNIENANSEIYLGAGIAIYFTWHSAGAFQGSRVWIVSSWDRSASLAVFIIQVR